MGVGVVGWGGYGVVYVDLRQNCNMPQSEDLNVCHKSCTGGRYS